MTRLFPSCKFLLPHLLKYHYYAARYCGPVLPLIFLFQPIGLWRYRRKNKPVFNHGPCGKIKMRKKTVNTDFYYFYYSILCIITH